MSEYVPTTDEVRGVWAALVGNTESFDRWLQKHDSQTKAETWDEGYSVGFHDDQHQPNNPYLNSIAKTQTVC